ncbi:MAG: hypothetical protein JNG90_12190 [Planctomycetaceae bacterium]|nr:hypothetical protein [Planctomycetaceae bacterium]
MQRLQRGGWAGWLGWIAILVGASALAQEPKIPDALRPWQDWVTWGDRQRHCPTPFNDASARICFWPSVLSLTAEQTQARWNVAVRVFDETWVPLPGSSDTWPLNVQADGQPLAVLEREGKPFVRLTAGAHQLTGEFHWQEMPQRVALPHEVGILTLVVDGQPVELPNWDADGHLWLKRQRAEAAEKDFLAPRVYRVIEDGVPLWLRTRFELAVSGKSREEQLGWILPEGWQLSYVESPIPVAVDQQGQVKAQVRAGNWTIVIDAFRTADLAEFRYPAAAQPMTATELIAWRAQPALRSAELSGVQAIDVTQTTFPADWRELPVYEWKTDSSFKLVEKLRGMGELHPEGLTIQRRLWLDDDGRGLTYRDTLTGQMQQIWRLDVAPGEKLGAVRIDGEGQLVTTNPQTGSEGVEIRNRNLNLDAIGRSSEVRELSATGWNTSADSLHLTFVLPPGWRVLAVLGADQVQGDWLTAWTLLDLFLLLIFALAVLRLWGFTAGLVALVAMGLAYHEPGAPRFTWLLLLMPLALLRVVPAGWIRRGIEAWKYAALALLAICLVPFLAHQVQTAIYPQLEPSGTPYSQRFYFPPLDTDMQVAVEEYADAMSSRSMKSERNLNSSFEVGESNLKYASTSKIQTGPAEPAWTWNQVHCQWNGPVAADQKIRPILISLAAHRALTVLRIVLLLALASILVRSSDDRRFGLGSLTRLFSKRAAVAGALLALALWPAGASGQEAQPPVGPIPDQQMLSTLRERLLQASDAYPHAAEIPTARLQLRDSKIAIETEVHAALEVAVPLPGRLPAWSPLSVKIDGSQEPAAVCRRDGYLWVIVPPGVHEILVEGLLAEAGEWEWTFQLKPRQVVVDAPDWNVTGIGPNGIPEQQVFFARKQRATESEAAYDRKDFQAVVAVERQIEAGLVWKVHNSVTRLSSPGKAISLKLPLLPGESVLTSNLVEQGGQIEVRLAAGETTFTWESELAITPAIQLQAQNNEQWVERWQLVASPVWDVAIAGLAPVFEAEEQRLIPAWHPWSGEEVTLTFTRPQAVSGDTVTVQSVNHTVELGDRQRTVTLQLELECSLASDFAISIDPEAEITSLTLDERPLPVRREGANVIVPAHPGKQSLEVAWKSAAPLETVSRTGAVSLPVDAANITTIMTVPESRWVLWADGPQRGPAVRFWVVLAVALLVALALGSASLSPLGRIEWVLLAIGLTQIHIAAALIVVVWLFLLAWRGRQTPESLSHSLFNGLQTAIIFLTVVSLAILVVVASKGLLGQPEMFIVGNGSWSNRLQWFQPRAGTSLPEPSVISISVWYYRYAMLAWALWLAVALLRWLGWGWRQFMHGGGWKSPFAAAPMKPVVVAEVVPPGPAAE